MPDDIDDAHDQIRMTQRPIEEIAAALGLSVNALGLRIRRRYGCTIRALRTGEATGRGRPAGDVERPQWGVRLSAEERAVVEAAIDRERQAGASTDGEALVRALWRAKQRSSGR